MKRVLSLLCTVLASGVLAAQAPVTQRATADLRAKIEAVVTAGRAPSVTVAVARDGRVVWSDALGVLDKTRGTPATPSTPYAVASLTKTFTATAVMVLNERGRLALDDPITIFLRSIARPNVASPSEVTIRRTLQNTAGFPVHTQWFYVDRPERPLPIAETLRCYGAETNKPGERYVYSNIGYGALGEVVARASGQTYESFLTREVLQPLGLGSATIARRAEDAVRAATPHGTDGEPIPFHLSDHPAASDLYINVEDLARFGLFHAGGLQPSRTVIGDASRHAMQEPGIGGYGFGWLVNVNWRDRRVIFNSGSKPGASSALWIVPADRVAVAVIANQIGAPVNQLAGEILASVLGLAPEPPAAPAAPAPAAPRQPRPPLPPPGLELRGQWRGTISSCPRTLELSLDIRDTHDLIATLGHDAAQVVEAGAAARGEASGTLKLSADMASSTLEFDLFVKDGRLEGPVIRRTNLGPRGNVTVTLWAVLSRK
jgi:CubicO group peptidase (beta-lactamase class C family)